MINKKPLTRYEIAVVGLIGRRSMEWLKLNHKEAYKTLVDRNLIKKNTIPHSRESTVRESNTMTNTDGDRILAI